MPYLLLSFIAGILTVFAPCVFTLLPVILGSTLAGNRNYKKPLIITLSLTLSVFIFTLLLKVSSAFINVPASFWNILSGSIIIMLGIITLFPGLWDKLALRLGLQTRSDELLQQANSRRDIVGEILTGAALGPVFSSCSPTYALILATVLPQDFKTGVLYLAVYSVSMGITLLLVSVLGQKLVSSLKWAVNPHGWFKRTLGILFIIIGIAIITGFDKQVETYLLDHGIFDTTQIELNYLNPATTTTNTNTPPGAPQLDVAQPYPAPDFDSSANWINSPPLHISDLKGKVVLVDFWTYSCINCIRTLPYVEQFYAKYKDQGLVVIGVHTPEFAFEKVAANVAQFAKDHNVVYPIVQDNDYKIWNAYSNDSWPAEYFIDKNGNVVNVHLGEGDYDKTEEIIQYLLGQTTFSSDLGNVVVPITSSQSPETYLGYTRTQDFENADQFHPDVNVNYTAAASPLFGDSWTIGGQWKITGENIQSNADGDTLKYKFSAKEVYLVMGASTAAKVQVMLNGKPVDANSRGDDVDTNGFATVSQPQLYRLIKLPQFASNQELELTFPAGVTANAFTFGS